MGRADIQVLPTKKLLTDQKPWFDAIDHRHKIAPHAQIHSHRWGFASPCSLVKLQLCCWSVRFLGLLFFMSLTPHKNRKRRPIFVLDKQCG
jgi:hypothetical protein